MDSKESFLAVRDHMMRLAKREKEPVKEGLGSTRVPLDDDTPSDIDTNPPGRLPGVNDED